MNQERVQVINISKEKTNSHNIKIFRFIQTALEWLRKQPIRPDCLGLCGLNRIDIMHNGQDMETDCMPIKHMNE